MQRTLIGLLTWILVLMWTSSLLAADKGLWAVEQGHIKKKHTVVNPATKSTIDEEIYFKQYGWVIATVRTTRSSNKFVKGETIERRFSLQEGSNIISINLDTMQGHAMELPMMKGLQSMNKQQQQQFAGGVKNAFGAKSEADGEEVVAGKTCQVTKTTSSMAGMKQTSRQCMWNNIMLKLVSEGMGTRITEEAVLVDTDTQVPEAKFQIPEGATISKRKK